MHPLAHYSLKDFDKYNCLKLSVSYYFLLAYLLKGYVVGLVSFSNFNDKLSVIRWFYPDSEAFYLSLVIGLPGWFFAYLLLQRRPEGSSIAKRFWPKVMLIATVLVSLNVAFSWGLYWWLELGDKSSLLGQSMIGVVLLWYCKQHKRAKINRTEFPEMIED
ncbi:DUF2919 family protein [Thalassotalea aquiviva]|uniref:DUF2919 family protein n=1 Tax=Thalassotalea aquiviva TaxID=3242415 RepID=UPI00352B69DE